MTGPGQPPQPTGPLPGPPPPPGPPNTPQQPGGIEGVQAQTPQLPPHENQNNDPFNPVNWLPFDTGGVWQPGTVGINTTGRPEIVFNADQWNALTAPDASGGVHNHWHVTVADVNELMGRVDMQKKLDMMRYSGRP